MIVNPTTHYYIYIIYIIKGFFLTARNLNLKIKENLKLQNTINNWHKKVEQRGNNEHG